MPLMSPAWSPDEKNIAYVTFENGLIKQITNNNHNNTEPSWFPDNYSLAYTSDQNGSPQIYKININNGQSYRLSWEGAKNQNSEVSSDGSFLAMSVWILIPLLTIASCTSKKNVKHIDSAAINTSENTDANISNSASLDALESVNAQELQQNNILYFDLDKYNIKNEFTQILDAHSDFLRNNPSYKIIIEGHADERGTSEYNIALGERRAKSVKEYLQSKGVLEEQMKVISYGKEKPAVLGHDEMTYAKNRRVVLAY
uniref:OmpA-like domain-containing protein n=1 Tax=Glossina austeni TaxID=7395 RepID=A0A1A9UKD3_GLOAU